MNYVVADTQKWEQAGAYIIDNHHLADAFIKNAGLGFTIPYLDNRQAHDYEPDFIVRLRGDSPLNLILETKGYDPRKEVKARAARRWVDAVNAEGSCGTWEHVMVERVGDVAPRISSIQCESRSYS